MHTDLNTRRADLTTAIAAKRDEFDRASLESLSDTSATGEATRLRGELTALQREAEDLDAARPAGP